MSKLLKHEQTPKTWVNSKQKTYCESDSRSKTVYQIKLEKLKSNEPSLCCLLGAKSALAPFAECTNVRPCDCRGRGEMSCHTQNTEVWHHLDHIFFMPRLCSTFTWLIRQNLTEVMAHTLDYKSCLEIPSRPLMTCYSSLEFSFMPLLHKILIWVCFHLGTGKTSTPWKSARFWGPKISVRYGSKRKITVFLTVSEALQPRAASIVWSTFSAFRVWKFKPEFSTFKTFFQCFFKLSCPVSVALIRICISLFN